MADLETLKQKYAPVIATLQEFGEYGATIDTVDWTATSFASRAQYPPR